VMGGEGCLALDFANALVCDSGGGVRVINFLFLFGRTGFYVTASACHAPQSPSLIPSRSHTSLLYTSIHFYTLLYTSLHL